MNERAASSTAVLVCQGRASAEGRYAVGRFSDPVARELLDPAERVVVDQVRAGRVPAGAGDRMTYELVRRTGLTMVPRTITIDEAIRDHAAGQLVILGAGLDARAWRMPDLGDTTVFEVDHPASQREKLRRVGGLAPTARRVVPVAVDLARRAPRSGPRQRRPRPAGGHHGVGRGSCPTSPATRCGRRSPRSRSSAAPGSRLVVNYQARSLSTVVMRAVMRLVLRVSRVPDPLAGEPWRSRWAPDGTRALLRDHGLDVVSGRGPADAVRGTADLPPEAAGSLRNGRVAVAVRQ